MKGCRVLEAHEAQALLNALVPRDRLLMLTGLTFGTRISETLALTFKAVSGRYLHLQSAKDSAHVSFEIPPRYQAEVVALQAFYEQSGRTVTDTTPLFLSRKGIHQAISRQQASEIITTACARLGIEGKVNNHSARKTFVTRIYHLTGKDMPKPRNTAAINRWQIWTTTSAPRKTCPWSASWIGQAPDKHDPQNASSSQPVTDAAGNSKRFGAFSRQLALMRLDMT